MNAQTAIRPESSRWSDVTMYGAIALWSVAVLAGWIMLQQHDFATNPPLAEGYVSEWPAASTIERKSDRPTLVLFMHPKCPCTRATLGELERMFTSVSRSMPTTPDTVVVNTVPADADGSWLDSETVIWASQLPNARVVNDRNGEEAARFGATTSGSVMFFDADGRRRYVGGVTASRGHEGDNVGRSNVAQLLRGERAAIQEMPSFGCRLCLPTQGASASMSDSIHATSSHAPVDNTRRSKSDVPQPVR